MRLEETFATLNKPAVLDVMATRQNLAPTINFAVAGTSPTSKALAAVGSKLATKNTVMAATETSPGIQALVTKPDLMQRNALAAVGKFPPMTELVGLHKLKRIGLDQSLATRHSALRKQLLSAMGDLSALKEFGVRNDALQKQFHAIAGSRSAREAAVAGWKTAVLPGFANQMASYQRALFADVAITAEPGLADNEPEIPAEVWFGAESWAELVWLLVTTLKALELMTAGLWATRGLLKVEFPLAVLWLATIVILTGELAARFAEQTARRLDGEEN